ncbi:MAG: hypothetical protein AAFO93_04325 [Pseudomonadota bacterium]
MDRLAVAAHWFWTCGAVAGCAAWVADLYLRLPLTLGAAMAGWIIASCAPRAHWSIPLGLGLAGGICAEWLAPALLRG